MRSLAVSFGFVVCLLAGQLLVTHSWDGAMFVYLGEERAPASVRRLQDYTEIDGSMIKRSPVDQLLARARVDQSGGSIGIRLGHPMLAKSDGRAQFLCSVKGVSGMYDRVELTFTGVGIASAGTPARMVIESLCESKGDELSTIWIPVSEIVSTQARDQEFLTEGESPVRIRVLDVPGEWPGSWSLTSVRFFQKADPSAAMTLGSLNDRVNFNSPTSKAQ